MGGASGWGLGAFGGPKSFRLSLSADPVDRALEDLLPPTARSLVQAIREHERISTGDVVTLAGRSTPAVLRDLRALEDAGIIEWIGASPKDPRAFGRSLSELAGLIDGGRCVGYAAMHRRLSMY